MNMKKAWYIRRPPEGEIKGPFPGGQISQEILLGRYRIDDEVSHDKEEWFLIRKVPELLPDIFRGDRNDPAFKDRLAAARRWADERRGVAEIDSSNDRRAKSSYESEEIKRLHRLAEKSKEETSPWITLIQISSVLLVIITLIVLAFQYSPKDKAVVNCSDEAKQAVNWSDCNLSGIKLTQANLVAANLMNTNLQTANLYSADLSHANLKYAKLQQAKLIYANFTKADLKGASLTGADLSSAIFIQADLSYANLRDAVITGANFENARLDHAIWIDGRTCKVNSISTCY